MQYIDNMSLSNYKTESLRSKIGSFNQKYSHTVDRKAIKMLKAYIEPIL